MSENWTVDDPRMWKEQCRIGDVAFQHLFVTSKGLLVPDWVKDGLPKMYGVLVENAALRTALQKLLEWYDRDGSVGGLCDPMEDARELLKE